MTGWGSGDHDAARVPSMAGDDAALASAANVGVKTGLALAPVKIAMGSVIDEEVVEGCDASKEAGDDADWAGILFLASSSCCKRLERALS